MESKELAGRDGGQSGVLDRLPFNLTQLLAFAMQKPRDMVAAMDNAIMQLRAAPQFAAKAYYSIPFKRRNADGSYTEEIVEGPSIKAATALTGCWGNNVEGGFVGEETEDYIDVAGYFFDYETGKLTIRPWRVSKNYRTKEGKTIPWRYDMLLKQIQAGVSKAIRNADLNGLPAGYVAEYYAEAKRIAARGGKIESETPSLDAAQITAQYEKCLLAFETLGVERPEVVAYVSRHPELTDEEMVTAHLIGLLNALEAQEVTIEDVFTVPHGPIAEPQKATDVPRGTPETQTEQSKALPKDRFRLQAKFDAPCSSCGKTMKKGVWIYKTAAGKYAHEVGPKGTPC